MTATEPLLAHAVCRTRMIVAAAVLAASLTCFWSSTAQAHKPIFLHQHEQSLRVDDASVSYAAYGTFHAAGDSFTIRGPLTVGDTLLAQILVPDALPERRGSRATWPRLTVTTPSGTRIPVPFTTQPEKFHEPFTQTNYLTVSNLSRRADAQGVYRWTATAQRPGRFVVVLGTAEQFGASDVAALPRTVSRVRTWARGSKRSTLDHPAPDAASPSDATSAGSGAVDDATALAAPATRSALVVAALMLLASIIGIATRDNSYVDLFWGINFVGIAVGAFSTMDHMTPRTWVVGVLVTAWAVRLTWHLTRRKLRTPGEDFRYATWRAQWGRTWVVRSLLQVYCLQGILALIVGAPIVVVAADASTHIDPWLLAGIGMWTVGIAIEMVADMQITRFVARRATGIETSRMCTTGLWSMSRHPNYFGEAVAWWGVGLAGAGASLGLLGLIGPLTITLLIRYVSGVPLLEQAWRDRPGFAEWAATTPVFVPWPRTGRRSDSASSQ